jgi:hypothetical protein
LENPQETDSIWLSRLGQILAAFCRLLPSARRTQLLALSNMLLEAVSKQAAEGKPKDWRSSSRIVEYYSFWKVWNHSKIRLVHKKDRYASLASRRFCASSFLLL